MADVLEVTPLTPPRVSLLSAANIIPVSDSRWESGFDVEAEGCEVAYSYAVCPDEQADPKDADGYNVCWSYQPYVVYASDKASTFATARRDPYGRATRKLILAESTRLEAELWLGTSGGNPALAGWIDPVTTNPVEPTTITFTGTQTPAEGLAALDQALGNCSSGRGMIHVRPAVLPYLLEKMAVRREGNVYLSPMDNIVVPGRGYPGTGPAGQAVGATEWMFANTGIVEVRHSEIILTPPQNDQASQYDRSVNDRIVRAERVTHVALDPSCCVLATEITNPVIYGS